jgi:hypothetical protein
MIPSYLQYRLCLDITTCLFKRATHADWQMGDSRPFKGHLEGALLQYLQKNEGTPVPGIPIVCSTDPTHGPFAVHQQTASSPDHMQGKTGELSWVRDCDAGSSGPAEETFGLGT